MTMMQIPQKVKQSIYFFLILHAVVPHLPKASMTLGKEKSIRKHTEGNNLNKEEVLQW